MRLKWDGVVSWSECLLPDLSSSGCFICSASTHCTSQTWSLALFFSLCHPPPFLFLLLPFSSSSLSLPCQRCSHHCSSLVFLSASRYFVFDCDSFLSLAQTQYTKNTTYSLERYWLKFYSMFSMHIISSQNEVFRGTPFPLFMVSSLSWSSHHSGSSWLFGSLCTQFTPCSLFFCFTLVLSWIPDHQSIVIAF